MATEYEIDDILVERFANGNGTIFAGAGISFSSRLPSWDDLILPMRKDLGREAHRMATAQEVAELYEAKHGRAVMIKHLRERLGDVRSQMTRTHELLVQLPVSRIYTTNFDTLLEQASSKLQINRNVIYNASQVGFSDNSQLSIVKLHGDLSDSDSIVISANDYYSYFTRNPAVADLLKVELQTHTVLFIGYSFRDASLGMILGEVSAQLGKGHPPWYSLQPRAGLVAQEAMKGRGVKVISLDTPGGTPESVAAVQDWLTSFQRALNRRDRRTRHQPARTAVNEAHALPAYKRSTFGRATRERIEAGLRSDFRVLVVKGEAGIGKTQYVAACVADHLAPLNTMLIEHRFERVIWIRPPTDEADKSPLRRIFSAIIAALPLPIHAATHSVPEKLRDRVNWLLQEHRVIVVIEDLSASCKSVMGWLEDRGQFANPRSRIIVTTRDAVVAGFVVEVAPLAPEDGAAFVTETASAMMLRRNVPAPLTTADVLSVGAGNPQAILLALGLINGRRDVNILRNEHILNAAHTGRAPAGLARQAGEPEQRPPILDVFRTLIGKCVAQLDETERSVLRLMLLFPSKRPLPEYVIKAVLAPDLAAEDGVPPDVALEKAISRVTDYNLVERDRSRATLTMPTIPSDLLPALLGTRSVASDYYPVAQYLLDFLKRPDVICRDTIPDDYWNSVLRDEMQKVDPLWPLIRHVMRKLDKDPYIVEFVMLLCHYMDNRSHNADRIAFVRAALAADAALSAGTRALLSIDALGWTYMEEGRGVKANAAIDAGLKHLNADEHPGLYALAEAFRARLDAEEGDFVSAESAIDKAFGYAAIMDQATGAPTDDSNRVAVTTKPWIWTRLYMIRGDVRLIQCEPPRAAGATNGRGAASTAGRRPPHDNYAGKALRDYEEAAWLTERYGGEGNAYQTGPRIGLALLQAGTPADIARAEKIFERLACDVPISLGYLYGEYGLAMIKVKKNANQEALDHLLRLQSKLQPHLSSGNTLLKLIRQSCDKVEAEMEAARR